MIKVGEKGKKRKDDKISIIRLVVWCVVTTIVLVVVNLKDAIYADRCASPLVYQAEFFDVELAIDKLQLTQGANNQATRMISEAVHNLVGQSVRLCELLHESRIAREVHEARQNRLSQQFGQLLLLQQSTPADSVTAVQLRSYRQAIKKIKQ